MSAELTALSVDVIRPMYDTVTVFSGRTVFEDGAPEFTGAVHVTDQTDATSASTGSITDAGGLGVTKNANVGGDLRCGGPISATGGVSVDGSASVGGSLTCAGGLSIPNGGVGVAGAARLGGTTMVAGAVTSSGGVTVAGVAMVEGDLSMGGALTYNGVGAADLSVGGGASATAGGLGVSGGLAVSATLTATGGCSLDGGLASTGKLTAGQLAVDGTTTVAKDVLASGTLSSTGTVTCDAAAASTTPTTGALTVAGSLGVPGTLVVGSQLRLGPAATRVRKSAPFRHMNSEVAAQYNLWWGRYMKAGRTSAATISVPLDCERNSPFTIEARMFSDRVGGGDYSIHVLVAVTVDQEVHTSSATLMTVSLGQLVVKHVTLYSGTTPDTDKPASIHLTLVRENDLPSSVWILAGVLWYESRVWGGPSH